MRVRCNLITALFWTVLGLLLLSTSPVSKAAEWAARPSIRTGLEYNDNPQLTIQPHDSVHGYTIAPKLDLSVNSEIWQIMGSMEASRKRYPGNDNLNRDDQVYGLTTSYRTERSTWRLEGSRSESSTIAEEQITPDTGLVEVPRKYDSHNVSPSWTWAMTELTQLQLAYSLGAVSYVNGQSIGLYDYSTRTVSAQLTNHFDFKDQVFISAGYSIFNVPATSFESKSAVFQGGVTRSFSKTMRGSLSAGSRKTSNEQNAVVCTLYFGPSCIQTGEATQSSRQTSSVFNASLEKKFETARLDLNASRAFNPSGSGVEVVTDSQSVMLSKSFTALLTGNLAANNYNFSPQPDNGSDIKRHYYSFSSGLSWAWTRELDVSCRYKYGHIKRAAEDQDTSSNAIYLTLGYRWHKMVF